MSYFFSGQTNSFYNLKIHGENMPEDVVEVSDSSYLAILGQMSLGKILTSDEAGNPITEDPPALTQEQIDLVAQHQAESYLRETNQLVIHALETGGTLSSEVETLRAAAYETLGYS